MPGPLRSRPVDRAQVAALNEVGYQQVATTRDTGAMSVYMHRIVKSLGGTVGDEYKLLALAPMYNGQVSVKTFADLVDTLKASNWTSLSATSTLSYSDVLPGGVKTEAPESDTMAV